MEFPRSVHYAMNLMLHSIETDKKPASETPWTKKLWSYDLRTNRHFTLKTSSLHRSASMSL